MTDLTYTITLSYIWFFVPFFVIIFFTLIFCVLFAMLRKLFQKIDVKRIFSFNKKFFNDTFSHKLNCKSSSSHATFDTRTHQRSSPPVSPVAHSDAPPFYRGTGSSQSTLDTCQHRRSHVPSTSSVTHSDTDPYYWDTGKAGERYTKEVLVPLSGFKHFVSNCYIPKPDGTLTEIDLILLHISGIYVIESKNYSGLIYGHEEEQKWEQILPNGRPNLRETYFFNPIIQNQVHVKWLRKQIGDKYPIYSYIVFSDRCELKEITLTSGNHVVVNRRNLYRTIRKKAETLGEIIDQATLDSLYHQLYQFTKVTEEQKALHVEIIQQKKKQAILNEGVCPLCGKKLVLRIAKKGKRAGEQFWGCSNYPKCRFTMDIN